jgi:tetratricopeptide (TPR) repeat protein
MARLTGVEAEFLKNISTMQKINELNQTQKYKEAYALFSTLPAALQKDKTVLMTKLLVAQHVGDNEYAQVIRELELNFPNDAARDFRAMDLLAMQEQHDELIKTVDRLLTVIQDPYLNILKVDSLLALNRTDEARQAVAEAKAVAENRIDVYWVEMSMLLKARNHSATATLLDEIGEKFGMTFNDLTTVPEYAEFAESPVGKDWMARHATDLPDSSSNTAADPTGSGPDAPTKEEPASDDAPEKTPTPEPPAP